MVLREDFGHCLLVVAFFVFLQGVVGIMVGRAAALQLLTAGLRRLKLSSNNYQEVGKQESIHASIYTGA